MSNTNEVQPIKNESNCYILVTVADPGFGQGGGQEFFSEILPT